MKSSSEVVKAAGCVAWRRRRGASPALEIVIVHRPSPHDDWSLPKGKLHSGERFRDAAVRELREEAGMVGNLGPELLTTRYRLGDGRMKKVRWWSLEVVTEDDFVPNDEIDGCRWIPADSADEQLTWDTDRDVLGEFRRTAQNQN